MTDASATHQLELETFEAVVAGGVRRVTWLLEQDEEWLLVSEVATARVVQLDCGPGVVWQRQVTVALPVGARLMRVESRPKPVRAQDPLAYLLGPPAGAGRETRRSQFVLAASGRLERLPPPAHEPPKSRQR